MHSYCHFDSSGARGIIMMLQNKSSLWLIVQLLGFAIDVCHGVELGGDCSANACTTANSHCVGDECVCETGFKENAGACLKGGKKGDTTCSKIIGSACTAENENTVCSVTNSECKGDVCACKVGYTGDATCSKIIGSTCTGTAACSGDENTICKEDKCVCKEDYADKNDVCTQTVSGTDCTSDTACSTIGNAVCDTDTSKCKCDADFTMNVDKCDPKSSAAMAGFGAIVLSLSVLTARYMMF
ncbi:cell death abnormality protein 1-like [Ruditapes philippinarum]|uniref:cell death abnormality protein 1-like n=1 Tax=Ruditapes philippinarum TaxID=129788 RepID=UPI00295BAA51|nr:cell death abnormality protein 1-like [Ruditapes philippinarum]